MGGKVPAAKYMHTDENMCVFAQFNSFTYVHKNNIWSNINKYHQFDVYTVRLEKAYQVLLYICSTQSQFNRTSLPLNI